MTPTTWHVTIDTLYVTPDMWHQTYDIWNLTPDTQGVMNIVSKCLVTRSYGLGVNMFWNIFLQRSQIGCNGGVCRTAPATRPNITHYHYSMILVIAEGHAPNILPIPPAMDFNISTVYSYSFIQLDSNTAASALYFIREEALTKNFYQKIYLYIF